MASVLMDDIRKTYMKKVLEDPSYRTSGVFEQVRQSGKTAMIDAQREALEQAVRSQREKIDRQMRDHRHYGEIQHLRKCLEHMGVDVIDRPENIELEFRMSSHAGDHISRYVDRRCFMNSPGGLNEVLHVAEQMKKELAERAIVKKGEVPRYAQRVKEIVSQPMISIDEWSRNAVAEVKEVTKKVKKKLGFYQKLEKEADEWLSDVKLAA